MYSVSNKPFEDYELAIDYARKRAFDWALPGIPCVPVVEDKRLCVAVVTNDERGVMVHELADVGDSQDEIIGF